MDFYGWRLKEWKFDASDIEEKRQEMLDWCEKNKARYQTRQRFINNAWAVEYRPLLHM